MPEATPRRLDHKEVAGLGAEGAKLALILTTTLTLTLTLTTTTPHLHMGICILTMMTIMTMMNCVVASGVAHLAQSTIPLMNATHTHLRGVRPLVVCATLRLDLVLGACHTLSPSWPSVGK